MAGLRTRDSSACSPSALLAGCVSRCGQQGPGHKGVDKQQKDKKSVPVMGSRMQKRRTAPSTAEVITALLGTWDVDAHGRLPWRAREFGK